jgi:hypothetical protein
MAQRQAALKRDDEDTPGSQTEQDEEEDKEEDKEEEEEEAGGLFSRPLTVNELKHVRLVADPRSPYGLGLVYDPEYEGESEEEEKGEEQEEEEEEQEEEEKKQKDDEAKQK